MATLGSAQTVRLNETTISIDGGQSIPMLSGMEWTGWVRRFEVTVQMPQNYSMTTTGTFAAPPLNDHHITIDMQLDLVRAKAPSDVKDWDLGRQAFELRKELSTLLRADASAAEQSLLVRYLRHAYESGRERQLHDLMKGAGPS